MQCTSKHLPVPMKQPSKRGQGQRHSQCSNNNGSSLILIAGGHSKILAHTWQDNYLDQAMADQRPRLQALLAQCHVHPYLKYLSATAPRDLGSL